LLKKYKTTELQVPGGHLKIEQLISNFAVNIILGINKNWVGATNYKIKKKFFKYKLRATLVFTLYDNTQLTALVSRLII